MTSAKPTIGEGIYTAADAARIMKIPYSQAKYWFHYYLKNKLTAIEKHQYYFAVENIIAVNFLTLMEMYVFYQLKERGVSSRSIREAHSTMSKLLDTPYPFANEAVLLLGKKNLYFDFHGDITSSNKSLQYAFPQVVIPFSEKIEFDNNGIVTKYYPLGKKKTIVVNPANQFGQPVIEGTNILAETIYMLRKGKESEKSISELFGISRKNIRDAVAFAEAA